MKEYAKISFDDADSNLNKNIYEVLGNSFFKLVYTIDKEEKLNLGIELHWSEICSQYEPIHHFKEEENYWLKT